MTTTFDISSFQVNRTFRERIADWWKTGMTAGIFTFLLFIVFAIPLLLLALIDYIYGIVTKRKSTFEMDRSKDFLIDNSFLTIKSIDLENVEFYNKMKRLYGLDAAYVDDIDDVCFIQSEPQIDYFTDKLFTPTMIEFNGGIIMQEVNFDNWTCKLIFINLSSFKVEIIKDLDFTYDLTFEKANKDELKIVMRRPGEKKALLLKMN